MPAQQLHARIQQLSHPSSRVCSDLCCFGCWDGGRAILLASRGIWIMANELFSEVDRAVENLYKSGKVFNNTPSRRESLSMTAQGRGFPEYG